MLKRTYKKRGLSPFWRRMLAARSCGVRDGEDGLRGAAAGSPGAELRADQGQIRLHLRGVDRIGEDPERFGRRRLGREGVLNQFGDDASARDQVDHCVGVYVDERLAERVGQTADPVDTTMGQPCSAA